ncbi:hypothetical protein [Reyranella sp.]|uniref:hypothetical protein n=1 Tax=Reyranella sp. TaxID=1929291 RepID=UPI003D0F4E1F
MTSSRRAPQYPETEAITLLSFTVRRQVPVEIQRKLPGWGMEALHKPEVHKRPLEIGITTPPRDWEIARAEAFLKRERELWTKYINLANVKRITRSSVADRLTAD